MPEKVLIIGTNDMATACALRLFRAGFSNVLISHPVPGDLYYFRNFSSVLVAGSKIIAGIKAQSYADYLYNQAGQAQHTVDSFVNFSLNNRQIAVLSPQDFKKTAATFDYCLICDQSLYEQGDIKLADMICISCVEQEYDFCTYKIIIDGPHCGRVRYPFLEYEAAPPGKKEHLLNAAMEAVFVAEKSPGDRIMKGERIGLLGDKDVPADREGFVAGIMRSGLIVHQGQALACIREEKPPAIKELPHRVCLVSGGVLEAIMYDIRLNSVE